MIYRPPTNGILMPYPWYIDPPYPWYIDTPIHGILTPLPMVYRTPYPWYFDPSAHLLIRNEGVKFSIRGAIYHG
jgi:hypothetical protein